MYNFEGLAVDASRALYLAQEEAERAQPATYIGTDHLLLGVLRVTEGEGARVLAEIGVDFDAVHARRATMWRRESVFIRRKPPTSRVKRVVELAFEEATRTSDGTVTTGHLVIGLLVEGKGTGARILKKSGVRLDDVRERLARP